MKEAEMPKVRFTWNMLYDCNYRCSYCFFEGKWKEYRQRNVYLSPDEWLEYWKRICDKYGPPYLIITGGEPFIYPNFIEIVKRLSDICYHVNISSNSSSDLTRFVNEIDPQKVSLSLSFQPEFDKLAEFIKRVLFIRKHNFNGCINFVAYPLFLKDINSYKETFASHNESLKVIPFFGKYQGKVYPQAYTQEEQVLIGINNGWFDKVRKKGSFCPAGQKTALIFPDGKVSRCGQIGENTILGNILDSNFNLLDSALPCEAEFCPCDEGELMPSDDREKNMEKVLERKTESKPIIQSEKVNRDISFTWDIHYKCNFRCPYCWFYKGWAEGAKRNIYLSPEKWMKQWMRIYDKYGRIRIEITGGEPFIYPDFIEIVKLLSSIHNIKVTTNMSGDIETFVREIDSKRVILDLNFHPLFTNIDTFIKKTLLLKEAGFKAGVCYLAYPPQMKQIDKFRKRFEEAGINFALAAFWGEYQGKKYPESYTEEEREFIRPFLGDVDRIVYHLKAKSPKGKLCNAGYKYAVIQADGNIVRCGQLAGKFIGNIMDDNFQLFDSPLACEAEACPCNEYINIIEENKSDDKANPVFQKELDKRERVVPAIVQKERPIEALTKLPKFPRLDPPYRVYWNWEITYECNYRCSYCVQWKEHKERYIVDIDRWKKVWDSIFEKYWCCHIRFSGGEPFIYPNFIDLIAMLTEKYTVDVTTNLSFDIDHFLKKISPGSISLSPSFHPEYVKMNEFLDKVIILNKKGFPAGVAFVAYPPHLVDLERYKSTFKKAGILFKIIPFQGEFEGKTYPESYNDEQRMLLEYVAKNSEDEVERELNVQWFNQNMGKKETRKNKLCRMGQMYARISPDGKVTRCCHYESGNLGNILDEDFRLLDEASPCIVEKCPCWKPMIVGYQEEKYPIFWGMPEHKTYELNKL